VQFGGAGLVIDAQLKIAQQRVFQWLRALRRRCPDTSTASCWLFLQRVVFSAQHWFLSYCRGGYFNRYGIAD
jgi:hypothetical protein